MIQTGKGYKSYLVFTSPGQYGLLFWMPINCIHPDQFGVYKLGLNFPGRAACKHSCLSDPKNLVHDPAFYRWLLIVFKKISKAVPFVLELILWMPGVECNK